MSKKEALIKLRNARILDRNGHHEAALAEIIQFEEVSLPTLDSIRLKAGLLYELKRYEEAFDTNRQLVKILTVLLDAYFGEVVILRDMGADRTIVNSSIHAIRKVLNKIEYDLNDLNACNSQAEPALAE